MIIDWDSFDAYWRQDINRCAVPSCHGSTQHGLLCESHGKAWRVSRPVNHLLWYRKQTRPVWPEDWEYIDVR